MFSPSRTAGKDLRDHESYALFALSLILMVCLPLAGPGLLLLMRDARKIHGSTWTACMPNRTEPWPRGFMYLPFAAASNDHHLDLTPLEGFGDDQRIGSPEVSLLPP